MTFDDLCDRLTSLYDVGNTRAVAVANERLSSMLGSSKSLRSLVSFGTTVSGQSEYTIPTTPWTVVEVYRVVIAYTSGDVTYKGTETLDALQDLQAGAAFDPGCGNYYAITPTTGTEKLLLSAAPTEAGAEITGNCAVLPPAIVYGMGGVIPIPIDCHRHLLAGCRAEVLDEQSRQDESAKFEVVFEAGVKRLVARQNSRGKGSDGHRMRYAGYDYR